MSEDNIEVEAENKKELTLDEQLSQLELELIRLINKAEVNGQLTDKAKVGLFKQVLMCNTKNLKGVVYGTYFEAECLNAALSAIAEQKIADELVSEDMVTEVGVWERTKNGDVEIEYRLRGGEIFISEHGSKPTKMQPTNAVISDIGRIKQSIQASLETPITITK